MSETPLTTKHQLAAWKNENTCKKKLQKSLNVLILWIFIDKFLCSFHKLCLNSLWFTRAFIKVGSSIFIFLIFCGFRKIFLIILIFSTCKFLKGRRKQWKSGFFKNSISRRPSQIRRKLKTNFKSFYLSVIFVFHQKGDQNFPKVFSGIFLIAFAKSSKRNGKN